MYASRHHIAVTRKGFCVMENNPYPQFTPKISAVSCAHDMAGDSTMKLAFLVCWLRAVFGNRVEVWTPLNGSSVTSDVPVFLGVSLSTPSDCCDICLELLEASGKFARLTCRPLSLLESSEQLQLQKLLPGERTMRASVVDKDGAELAHDVSTFRVEGSDVDIAAASSASGWYAAYPGASSESAARSAYFDAVYDTKFWTAGRGPGSGPGSTVHAAANAIQALRTLVTELDIQLIVDAPCGDGTWLKTADLSAVKRLGVDVSSRAVADYPYDALLLDLVDPRSMPEIRDKLDDPDRTLILCRHLLFHLPHEDGRAVLENLVQLGARWLLTSTYLRADDNRRHFVFADGHKINLFRPPFCAVDPIRLYRDAHPDQFLALFDLSVARPLLLGPPPPHSPETSTDCPFAAPG